MTIIKEIVIGSGALGTALARHLRAQGRDVTVVNRHGGNLDGHEVTACDLAIPQQLTALLGEHTRIYLCVAPAYSRWQQEFPPLIAGLCAAIKGRQVDIIYADNLYAYGPVNVPLVETLPSAATTKKGKVRAQVAKQLMNLHDHDGVRTCIIRSADFFGPGVYQSVVGFEVLSNLLSGKPVYLVGNPDMPHSLTYLPDLVHTMATLANEDGAYGEIWHTANSPTLSLKMFLSEAAKQAGQPLKIRTAGRLLLRMLGLFKPDMRELVEMLYLYEQPFKVEHHKISERFAVEPTQLATALEDTIAWVRQESNSPQKTK